MAALRRVPRAQLKHAWLGTGPRNGADQPIRPARRHRRVAFRDERAVAEPGVAAGESRHARQFAGHGHPGAIQKAARDFPKRGLAADTLAQRVGESADPERPDVGELRLIEHRLGITIIEA